MKKISVFMLFMALLFTACNSSMDGYRQETSSVSSENASETTGTSAEPPDIVENLLPVEEYSWERTEEVSHIVIHFTSTVVNNKDDPYNMKDIWQLFYDLEVSVHYVIDRTGTIHMLIPEDRAAWHAGAGTWGNDERYTNKMNLYSIGIELLGIGSYEDMQGYLTKEQYNEIDKSLIGFTQAQYESLALLIDDVCARHFTIEKDRNHIIGHSEYSEKKTDPGSLFDWNQLHI